MKYYLIEKYKGYEDRPCGSSYTAYEVREFNDIETLKAALLKGAKHDGELFPAKGLEFKISLMLSEGPIAKDVDEFYRK